MKLKIIVQTLTYSIFFSLCFGFASYLMLCRPDILAVLLSRDVLVAVGRQAALFFTCGVLFVAYVGSRLCKK